jgi:hypothetical protein
MLRPFYVAMTVCFRWTSWSAARDTHISEPRRDRGPADNCAVASKTATRSTWLPGRNVCREKRVDDIPVSISGETR